MHQAKREDVRSRHVSIRMVAASSASFGDSVNHFCLSAVEIANPSDSGIERRDCDINWSAAFGLSLS